MGPGTGELRTENKGRATLSIPWEAEHRSRRSCPESGLPKMLMKPLLR